MGTRLGALFALPVSGMAFLAGLAVVTRHRYRLAQLGSVLAILNVPNLCCVPGAAFGVWSLILLCTPEGRRHFHR